MPSSDYLTVKELAAKLGKSTRTIARWIKSGKIQGAHQATDEPNSPFLIDRQTVNKLLKKRGDQRSG